MIHADLIAAAAVEQESREKRYPALVAQGRLAREEANADITAWGSIAHWLRTGVNEISFAEMHLAAGRCLQFLEAKVTRDTGTDPDRLARTIERRDQVDAIHKKLAWYHNLNAELRARATAAKMVA